MPLPDSLAATPGDDARYRTAPVSLDLAPNTLAVARAMLKQQRAFRLAQLAQLRRAGRHGLRSADREINDSLLRAARSALRDVQNALRRMEAGSYGMCQRCQGPVELERLEILPQVALCMPCQRAAEG